MNNIFKIGDVVTVYRGYNKDKDINWHDTWTMDMINYIKDNSVIIKIHTDSVDLLLLSEYNRNSDTLLSRSYNFPIGCIRTDRRKKIIRLIENE